MPSLYAHYRFGKDVYKKLPESVRKEIRRYPDLYKIGLHGPDILFYYRPLWKNAVSGLGHQIHQQPGREFFERGRRLVLQKNAAGGEKSYLYGFLCHYILDSDCHGCVYQTMESAGACHTEIETEFDRFLMERDGLDPIRHCLTDHINPSAENAKVISLFFQGVSSAQVQKALRSLKWYQNLLLAPGRLKRTIVDGGMRLAGKNYRDLRGMMMNEEENPLCRESSGELYEKYREALKEAEEMLPAWGELLRTGEKLPERYERNFEG